MLFRSVLSGIPQANVHALQSWVEKWLLSVHPEKCKVMTVSSTGRPSSDAEYTIEADGQEVLIERVTEEKDRHIQLLVNKGNIELSPIRTGAASHYSSSRWSGHCSSMVILYGNHTRGCR